MDGLVVTFSSDVFAQRVGGVSRYLGQLVRDLPEFGVTARAAAGFHNNVYLSTLPRAAVQGIHLPINSDRVAAHVATRLNAWTRRCWLPTSGIYPPSYYTAVAPATPLPTVVTVYDMIHEKMPQYFDRGDETPRQKAEWVRRADAIVSISQSTKDDLVEILSVPPDKVTVIHPGIEVPSAPSSGWPDRLADVVLYVGQRGRYKNWATLIRAMTLPELSHLRLVCFGGGACRRSEAETIEQAGLSRRVEFVSGDDDALAGWYRRASVLVYPSQYEGYGYPPLEALANQCPVVCGSTSSLAETVGHLATVVQDVLDEAEIAHATQAAIGTVVADGIDLPSCGAAARGHAAVYRSVS
jgi:glycosyltransferase involved in cell wall biosynthesis